MFALGCYEFFYGQIDGEFSCHIRVNKVFSFCFSSMLEKNLRQLMGCVDEVAMDANRFLNYQRQYQKQIIQKQQYQQKRVCRSIQFLMLLYLT